MSIALFYLTYELPLVIDKILLRYFPDIIPYYGDVVNVIEVLRPAGYLSLTIVVSLIVLSMILKRRSTVLAGTIAFCCFNVLFSGIGDFEGIMASIN